MKKDSLCAVWARARGQREAERGITVGAEGRTEVKGRDESALPFLSVSLLQGEHLRHKLCCTVRKTRQRVRE